MKKVTKLLKKKVITKSCQETGQVVSPIIVREKKDGSHRMILNLKSLNENIKNKKFKMETVQTALQLITQNSYFASIDLRDAYYSTEVHKELRKHLNLFLERHPIPFSSSRKGSSTSAKKIHKTDKTHTGTLARSGTCHHLIHRCEPSSGRNKVRYSPQRDRYNQGL